MLQAHKRARCVRLLVLLGALRATRPDHLALTGVDARTAGLPYRAMAYLGGGRHERRI